MRRLLLLLALLLAPVPAAAATCPYTPSAGPWYWSVQDSSPGTQVWAGNGGAFVVLADSTYVAWVAAGCTPTTIDTALNLDASINLLARTAWANAGTGLTTVSAASNTLANPLTSVIVVNYAGGSATVTMPKQNLPNSVPIGEKVTFVWGGVSGSLTIFAADGSTQIAKVLSAGDIVTITPSANTTTNGGWRIVAYNVLSLTPGTGTNGQLRIGQGTGNAETWLNPSGDCALAASGALTCTKTNNVAFAASATTDTTNASNISSGTLPAGRLPNPSASTLGGVESLVATTHQWINTISTSGVPSSTQPACGDLSNAAASCSTDTTNASNISSGTLATARGGVDQAAFTSYTPTFSAGSGTITTATATGAWKQNGKLVCFWAQLNITTNGTGAGSIVLSAPATIKSTNWAVSGVDYSDAAGVFGYASDTGHFTVLLNGGAYPGGNGNKPTISGCYEAA